MHPYSQPAGVPAFNPSQIASQGQFGATPFGNQSFASQPGSTYGAPSAGSQPFLTDPTAAYAQQPQLQPQQPPQFAPPGVFGFPQVQQSQPFAPPGVFGFPQVQQSQPFAPPGVFGFPQVQQSQPFAPPGVFGFPQVQQSQPFVPPGVFGFPQVQQSQPFVPPGVFGFPQVQQSQPFVPPGVFGFPQVQQSQPFGGPQFGAGQIPRLPTFLPDPTLAAYAHQLQQAQLAQQFAPSPVFGIPPGQFAQPFIPSANLINPAFAQLGGAAQFPRPSPFADPLVAIYAQQLLQAQLAQQFTPPGFFGAPLPQFAAGIGSIYANPALAAASQIGRYPPFAAPILH